MDNLPSIANVITTSVTLRKEWLLVIGTTDRGNFFTLVDLKLKLKYIFFAFQLIKESRGNEARSYDVTSSDSGGGGGG